MPGAGSEGASPTPRTINIEPGGLEDLAEVLALSEACADAPHWPVAAWENLLESSLPGESRRSVLLLAKGIDAELLGWLAGTGIYETAELEYVFVHPARRGQGVAGHLLRQWLAWAESWGATEAMLEVRPSNAAAIRLYREHGFVERGLRRLYYDSPKEDALLMWRAMPRDS